jgi:hypothetical protein
MLLNTHVTLQAFDKWEIDFIGSINPQEFDHGQGTSSLRQST